MAETEIYRESLDARWASIESLDPKAVRPETAIVRYVTIEEHFGLVADCVNEQGFTANLGADGGITFGEVPKAQGTALNVAVFVCQASYPLEDKYTLPPTEDQLRRLYEYQANESVACLTALGYTVSPPPSLQQFLDTFNTQDAWSPFAEALATATEEESIEANAVCPQQPDDLVGMSSHVRSDGLTGPGADCDDVGQRGRIRSIHGDEASCPPPSAARRGWRRP